MEYGARIIRICGISKKKADYFPQDSANNNALLQIIKEKDIKIIEQAEEIGRLKERIAQLEREKGKDVSDARIKTCAQ